MPTHPLGAGDYRAVFSSDETAFGGNGNISEDYVYTAKDVPGHGVGFVGPIHEGPQSLRMTNHVPFQPGMTITDEPGIYEEGLVGVRIENELLVVEHMETKYGKFYAFQPFTYLPIDTTPVVLELMNEEEISWLNDYHHMVYDTLSPRMTERERIWLKEKTKPLEK